MNREEVYTRLAPFLKRYALPVSLGFLGVILFGYGLISFIFRNSETQDFVFTSAEESIASASTSAKKIKQVMVDVSGEVLQPGVYNLDEGSRIKDAIDAAGGFSNEADQEFIAQRLNLAAKVVDGSKIYIPLKGEEPRAESIGLATESQSSGLININDANLSELDSLSGVGAVTAQKIIDNRPYQAVEELMSKKVVSKSVYEKIKDKISLY